MIFKSHLFSMIFFALIVSIVFSFIKEETSKSRIRYGIILFISLVVGAILFGWFMYIVR